MFANVRVPGKALDIKIQLTVASFLEFRKGWFYQRILGLNVSVCHSIRREELAFMKTEQKEPANTLPFSCRLEERNSIKQRCLWTSHITKTHQLCISGLSHHEMLFPTHLTLVMWHISGSKKIFNHVDVVQDLILSIRNWLDGEKCLSDRW